MRSTAISAALLTFFLGTGAAPLAAQNAPVEWNDSATQDLVSRAIARRSVEVVDTAMQSYRADGRGFVYFLLDAPELNRQTLVRTDQVALEVNWRAPNQIRQRIVGLRQRQELPVARLHYYLDRLTVVQDNYGQAIVIADGDNVRDVPHPIAYGSADFYDYQSVDSMTLRIPGVPDPVRVHEVRVRPRDASVPAVVGSVFLEMATGALVRMAFTFTPSSYVDPRLDYINVTLENGLWRGRFWLPSEQSLEIRRELPELDLPFGTIIRTRMRVNNYRFNEPLDPLLFASRTPVTFAPVAQRESFEFEQPIDAEWRLEGIGRPMAAAEIRREARAALQARTISGMQNRRLSIGSVSDVFRYNRAEGVALGAGGNLQMATMTARLNGGWSFGSKRPVLRADVATGEETVFSVSGYLNRLADVGSFQPSSRAANTLGALFLGTDWSDPFFVRGGSVAVQKRLSGGQSVSLGTRVEVQRSAALNSTFSVFGSEQDFRPVRPIDEGTHVSASVSLRREQPSAAGGLSGEVRFSAGRLDGRAADFDFGRLEVDLANLLTASRYRASADLSLRGRMMVGDAPQQELFLLGGRATLPGYAYRAFGGDRAVIGNLTLAADLVHPWLRGRLLGSAGWSAIGSTASRAAQLWGVDETDGVRATGGIGMGLFYDLLRIDLVRGFSSGGRTEVIVEFQPEFWNFL